MERKTALTELRFADESFICSQTDATVLRDAWYGSRTSWSHYYLNQESVTVKKGTPNSKFQKSKPFDIKWVVWKSSKLQSKRFNPDRQLSLWDCDSERCTRWQTPLKPLKLRASLERKTRGREISPRAANLYWVSGRTRERRLFRREEGQHKKLAEPKWQIKKLLKVATSLSPDLSKLSTLKHNGVLHPNYSGWCSVWALQ